MKVPVNVTSQFHSSHNGYAIVGLNPRSFTTQAEQKPAGEKQFTELYVDIEFQTLTEMIEKTVKVHSTNRALGTRSGPTTFDWLSYQDMGVLIEKTRKAFSQLGVGRNDKVALISNNRWEWATITYGTLGLGGQVVPMYEAMLEKDWRYIVEDSDAKIIVAATEAVYNQIKDYPLEKVGKVEKVLCLDAPEDNPCSYK